MTEMQLLYNENSEIMNFQFTLNRKQNAFERHIRTFKRIRIDRFVCMQKRICIDNVLISKRKCAVVSSEP